MSHATRPPGPLYRERLSPSLWVLVAAAVCAPMVALALSPIDTTLALVAGGGVAALLVAGLVIASPTILVEDGLLRAGRARIPVELVGEATAFTGEQARAARGRDLDPRSWCLVRGGIDGVAVVPIQDENDPAPSWVLSSRTPDRLAAAVRRAQATPSTPGR